jgi:hypothetical protein
MQILHDRRRFLAILSAAGAAGLVGADGTDLRFLNELKRELKG